MYRRELLDCPLLEGCPLSEVILYGVYRRELLDCPLLGGCPLAEVILYGVCIEGNF